VGLGSVITFSLAEARLRANRCRQLLADGIDPLVAFLGLRGTETETDRITREFGIEYQIVHYKDQILVDHSAFGYLIDPHGHTRVRFDYEASAAQIAEDVRAVLNAP